MIVYIQKKNGKDEQGACETSTNAVNDFVHMCVRNTLGIFTVK